MTIRYILCLFGTLSPVLVSCAKKNLATLVQSMMYCGVARSNQNIRLVISEGTFLTPMFAHHFDKK
jgi:hypothetical protein